MVIQLSDIKPIQTAHGVGEKFILLQNRGEKSGLTQVAIGVLETGEIIELHLHSSMEEYFFFLDGTAIFIVDELQIHCKQGTFVQIKENQIHQLEANQRVRFLYWGVAL